ncbi:MAG: DUF429 domain-containing protein, partial [Acidimicrobiia bacterium]
ERRRLLATAGIHLPDHLGSAGVAPPADLHDAAVVAWSADRCARGTAHTLPDDPAPGEPVIWY